MSLKLSRLPIRKDKTLEGLTLSTGQTERKFYKLTQLAPHRMMCLHVSKQRPTEKRRGRYLYTFLVIARKPSSQPSTCRALSYECSACQVPMPPSVTISTHPHREGGRQATTHAAYAEVGSPLATQQRQKNPVGGACWELQFLCFTVIHRLKEPKNREIMIRPKIKNS